jgi:hypothetical protein
MHILEEENFREDQATGLYTAPATQDETQGRASEYSPIMQITNWADASIVIGYHRQDQHQEGQTV